MTQKLFVVPVVIAALMISFSLVLAARNAVKKPSGEYQTAEIQKRTAETIQLLKTEAPKGLKPFSAVPGLPVQKPKATILTREEALKEYNLGTIGKDECNMQQDNGVVQGYASWIWEGFQIAKWYDPEVYCDDPVYPYKISDVEFPLYKFTGAADTANIRITVYLQCEDSCDGPGTQIFLSDVYVIDSFYPNMIHIDLEDVVCVYEPFYIALIWEAGPMAMPSFIMDSFDGIPYCHQWFYDPDYQQWYEHYDWWSTPATVGMGMIRVSGYTEHGDCDPPPCDTTIEKLAGAASVAYYWKMPPNDQFLNEKFEMPVDHSGRLESFRMAYYATGTTGTPDPDFFVWLSDGTFPLDNNPPYQAIASFHKNYGELVFFPSYNVIDAHSHNLYFDAGEIFHVGFTHAHDAGDTLSILSSSGVVPPMQHSSGWDGSAWEDYWPYAFTIDAYICPNPPSQPTLALKCRPFTGYATPGDPPMDMFTLEVIQVVGYSQIVTLSLLSVNPPDEITATFDPNGVACPFTADVAITVGAAVPYGNYTLTFKGVGADMQEATCNVTLTVQPPYDDGWVNFYHGKQATSNFGGLGITDGENFVYNGTSVLCDASIISAIPSEVYDEQEDHMAMDFFDCEHVGFIPTQYMVTTDNPWCLGGGIYEEYYGEVAYSNFFTEEDRISCEWDSLFVIGLKHVESTDFSIKIKIYYNPDGPDIPVLYAGLYEDWDVPTSSNNWGDMDEVHNLMWQYDPDTPDEVYGIMSVPFYDQTCNSMVFVYNPQEIYASGDSSFVCGNDPGPKYLFKLMSTPGFRYPNMFPGTSDPDDRGTLITSPPFALPRFDKHIEIWIDFHRNLADGMTWEQWYHKILRYAGFYRGDVNASDSLELPALDVSDLVYLVNYLYRGGPAPLPFADQGDVNGGGAGGFKDVNCPKNNVDVGDLIYLINYVYRDGPPPVDYVRFIPQYWSRPSLFTNPVW